MAQVKHLAGYNGSENVVIDERTLHEIYLPAFEAAVRAGVASVMCAYNRVNGFGSCENAILQNEVLRGQWSFRGFVASDWGAVHGPEAITRGLDLEMPGRELAGRRGPYFTRALLTDVEAIDRAAARILEQMDRFGLLGRTSAVPPGRIDVTADAAVARRVAEESAVLLKNESRALPLTAADLDSVVLIGPTAGQLAAGFMGERAYGFPERLVSPLEALRRLAARGRISSSPVLISPAPRFLDRRSCRSCENHQGSTLGAEPSPSPRMATIPSWCSRHPVPAASPSMAGRSREAAGRASAPWPGRGRV